MSVESTAEWMGEPTFSALSQEGEPQTGTLAALGSFPESSHPDSSPLCQQEAYSPSRAWLKFRFPCLMSTEQSTQPLLPRDSHSAAGKSHTDTQEGHSPGTQPAHTVPVREPG